MPGYSYATRVNLLFPITVYYTYRFLTNYEYIYPSPVPFSMCVPLSLSLSLVRSIFSFMVLVTFSPSKDLLDIVRGLRCTTLRRVRIWWHEDEYVYGSLLNEAVLNSVSFQADKEIKELKERAWKLITFRSNL